MRVYLLSDYEEHGSRNMVGTTDPAKLEGLLKANWPKLDPREINRLREAIAEGGLCDGRDLSCDVGWGGVLLHIVDLA